MLLPYITAMPIKATLKIVVLSLHALFLLAVTAQAGEAGFQRWLVEFKQEAREQGISDAVIEEAFDGVVENDRVVTLDRKQPEKKLTFEEYLDKVYTRQRVDEGRRHYAENKELLEKIAAQYGVPARFIVALWGMETSYGENMGSFEIVEALATLAYEGRRADFFRKELLNTLKIIQNEGYPASHMIGSWAGAMGQCQFMPSSYLRYAVDYNGDGKRDIWETQADVFASIANYLASEGWRANEGWESSDPNGEAHNYKVILKWNRSRYFATSVGMLADAIGEPS